VFFCGSYAGYGFHEDALVAGLDVAEQLGVHRPWRLPESERPPQPATPHLPDLVPLPARVTSP